MTVPPKTNRAVIPLWRGYSETARLGELAFNRPPNQESPWPKDERVLRHRTEDWERHRTLSFAADLVGSAVVLGSTPEAVKAARQLVASDNVGPLAKQAARWLIGEPEEGRSASAEPEAPDARPEIVRLRASLRRNARNPIRWSELSRFHTISGNHDKAAHAMRIARALAPTDRYVLRCAARFEVHMHRPDRAVAILNGGVAAREDPWLVAAILGLAAMAGEGKRLVRVGHRMMTSGSFSDFELTELASALGTLELQAGNVRHARRFFRQALNEPTDNSIAQIQWASHQLGIEIPADALEKPSSWEARAWTAAERGEYGKAVAEAWRWHYDEPFASRPAELGSYYAARDEDFESGLRIVESARRSNPRKFNLINNLAYCLAQVGRAEEAEGHLSALPVNNLDSREYAIFLATRALTAFRLRRFEEGRNFYRLSWIACADQAVRCSGVEQHLAEERRIESQYIPQLVDQLEAETVSR
jgi:tetratricopeptide (TPR) repeat protein